MQKVLLLDIDNHPINICSWNVGLCDCDMVAISFIWYMKIWEVAK